MTESMNNAIPGLDALAARYRQQTAPPGFTARVMAGIEQQPRRAGFWHSRWIVAAAVMLVVVISLPLLRDSVTAPPVLAQARPDTQVLAAAAGLLAGSERATQPSIADIPNVMSVQSIADIPDPFS